MDAPRPPSRQDAVPDPSKPTVQQQREARRAEKVAGLQKQLATQRRNRRIGIGAAIVAGVAVLSLAVGFIVVGSTPKPNPDDIDIAGLTEFPGLTSVHVGPEPVDYEAAYDMNPPAGGDHYATWLNCGVYEQPQPNENAVHALEHGAVWVTYDPEALDDAEIASLRDAVPSTYSVLSPFPGLPAPVVISAWGAQVQLEGVDDPRMQSFISKYWKSASAPEPGAPCTGGLDGAGRIA
ncbi:hypothetical protein IWX81_001892 [Salinibacterium sp. CAN_S4]